MAGTPASSRASGAPSGAAGGDLSGTYPNPALASIPDGLIVNADVNGAAAIAYSKLSLATSIVNADIGAAAAIAVSKLAPGTAGQVLGGTTPSYALPPGYEFSYDQFTSDASITQTVEGSATEIVTASAVTFDGATIVLIEFFSQCVKTQAAIGGQIVLNLWEAIGAGAAADIGRIAQVQTPLGTSAVGACVRAVRRLTPTAAAHTFSIRAWLTSAGTGLVQAGAGGAATSMPGFIRISKV